MRRSLAPSKRTVHSSTPSSTDQNNRSASDQLQHNRSAAHGQYQVKRQRVISEDKVASDKDGAGQTNNASRIFSVVWRKQSMKKVMVSCYQDCIKLINALKFPLNLVVVCPL